MITFTKTNKNLAAGNESEAGFSLIEMIIAITILTVGLISVAAAAAYALNFSQTSRALSENKLLVTSVIEQIEMLRNTKRLTYGQIANTGAVVNPSGKTFAGFVPGFQTVATLPGADGVYGTEDDDDDRSNLRPGFERQIQIEPLILDPSDPSKKDSNIKQVTVTVRYPTATRTKEISAISFINDDSRTAAK